jgi:hypothetical protein
MEMVVTNDLIYVYIYIYIYIYIYHIYIHIYIHIIYIVVKYETIGIDLFNVETLD